ncbi:MAG: adenine deaminase [Flavobacteriales bacterium]|nr:adenine deaminase [Flavobacteriales bacterium]
MVSFSVRGNLVDIPARKVFPARIDIVDGRIDRIAELNGPVDGSILPGFVDAHLHVESSMLLPSEFARLAVTHGTVATVSDPHEIANVMGMAGVEFMIANGKQVPFKFFFGAPSCVPATVFETAGARVTTNEVGALLEREDVWYLSEVMDFPGVLSGAEEVMKKIAHAQRLGKPVDGHAPGLRGDDAARYAAAGITTDHECFTLDEALDKLACGMHIQIREGSAAKNFEALHSLLSSHPDRVMFCSDDKHPDGLVTGHINELCARAVALGHDVFNVLRAACTNTVAHYRLPVGQLRVGDPADFIVVEDLTGFRVERTYINGALVAENGETLIESAATQRLNNFHCDPCRPLDFRTPTEGRERLVIEALDGQLITNKLMLPDVVSAGLSVPDLSHDILKIAVVNRYHDAPVATAWIKNFGLKRGAIASSVAHDSHNIVAVGTNDEDLCAAVNLVIAHHGGVSLAAGSAHRVLPLPIAGIMSDADAYTVADAYSAMDRAVKEDLGSTLAAPYMTLSFMALLVIPHVKLSDKGLFDGDAFSLLT